MREGLSALPRTSAPHRSIRRAHRTVSFALSRTELRQRRTRNTVKTSNRARRPPNARGSGLGGLRCAYSYLNAPLPFGQELFCLSCFLISRLRPPTSSRNITAPTPSPDAGAETAFHAAYFSATVNALLISFADLPNHCDSTRPSTDLPRSCVRNSVTAL